jgi:tetratricopeptide (TPR) repeat protein
MKPLSVFSYKFNITTVLILSIFILLMVSCNENTEVDTTHFDISIAKAKQILKKQPDSVLVLTDKLLQSSSKTKLNVSKLVALYLLRQEAFAQLKRMDSVVIIGERIRDIAKKNPDSLSIAQSLLPVKGDIDFATQQKMAPFFPGSIQVFKQHKMNYEQARLSASYGSILAHQGDFVNGQKQLIEAFVLFSKMDSIKPIINVCNNIGSTYSYTKNPSKALLYYQKAYEAALKVKNNEALSSILMNIGTEYNDSFKNHDKAISYYKKALAVLPAGTAYFLKMKIDYNMAIASFEKGDLSTSERTFKNMLDQCVATKEFEGVAMASKGLGDVYFKQKQPAKALLYLNRALHLSDSLGMKNESLLMLPSLLQLHKENNDYSNALQISERLKVLNDSILSSEKQIAVQEIEEKYQSEKKNIEIVNLQHISILKSIIVSVLLAFLVGLFFMLRYRNRLYREKQNAYAVLMKKYKEEREQGSKKSIAATSQMDSNENKVEDVIDGLFQKLMQLYIAEQPFLDPKLKLEFIAKRLNIAPRVLTANIKANGYSGFNVFTNKFRVEEVKRRFEDPKYANFKLEVIAAESGFGSKQTFYTAFEEFTGVNPGYFRDEIIKK